MTGTLHATDADGDHLIYALTTDASQGTATVHSDGTFTYAPTPEARHNAAAGGARPTPSPSPLSTDGGSASTSVTVTVAPEVVAPPQVGADTAVTDEDTPVTIAVLANDTGSGAPEASPQYHNRITAAHSSTQRHRHLHAGKRSFNGEDTFTYAVTDGTTPSQGAVNVTVNPVDDAPVINPSSRQRFRPPAGRSP